MRPPLRVLFIVFNQPGRGTYWRAFHLGRMLATRRHRVTLMATAPRARWRVTGVEVEGVHLVEMPDLLARSLRSGWDMWAVARRLVWLRERRFDIVHAFEARPTVVYPGLAAQRAGAKLIMDWCDWLGRGGSVEERPNPLVRAVLRRAETYFEERFRTRAAGTTVINRFLGRRAEALGVPRDSILLLRNGCDTNVPPMDPQTAKRAAGLPEGGPVVGYIGSIYPRDAELMARAFRRVRRVRPDARLLLVGHFNRDIERLLGGADGLIRVGPVATEMIAPYLSAAEVCWLPLCDSGANRGRWPMKLSDYMAVGRPTVTTNVGELAEVVEGHGMGVVTRPDPHDFAAATVALLGDEERQRAMGQAARRAAEGEFSWERLTEGLEQHYSRAMGG
jgi:glycosyltransferase involved in cell wall biosynthesis